MDWNHLPIVAQGSPNRKSTLASRGETLFLWPEQLWADVGVRDVCMWRVIVRIVQERDVHVRDVGVRHVLVHAGSSWKAW